MTTHNRLNTCDTYSTAFMWRVVTQEQTSMNICLFQWKTFSWVPMQTRNKHWTWNLCLGAKYCSWNSFAELHQNVVIRMKNRYKEMCLSNNLPTNEGTSTSAHSAFQKLLNLFVTCQILFRQLFCQKSSEHWVQCKMDYINLCDKTDNNGYVTTRIHMCVCPRSSMGAGSAEKTCDWEGACQGYMTPRHNESKSQCNLSFTPPMKSHSISSGHFLLKPELSPLNKMQVYLKSTGTCIFLHRGCFTSGWLTQHLLFSFSCNLYCQGEDHLIVCVCVCMCFPQNQSEQNQSNQNQSYQNQSKQNFLKSPQAAWSYFLIRCFMISFSLKKLTLISHRETWKKKLVPTCSYSNWKPQMDQVSWDQKGKLYKNNILNSCHAEEQTNWKYFCPLDVKFKIWLWRQNLSMNKSQFPWEQIRKSGKIISVCWLTVWSDNKCTSESYGDGCEVENIQSNNNFHCCSDIFCFCTCRGIGLGQTHAAQVCVSEHKQTLACLHQDFFAQNHSQ